MGIAGIWNPNESREGELYLRLSYSYNKDHAIVIICNHEGKKIDCGNVIFINLKNGEYSLPGAVTERSGFELDSDGSIQSVLRHYRDHDHED